MELCDPRVVSPGVITNRGSNRCCAYYSNMCLREPFVKKKKKIFDFSFAHCLQIAKLAKFRGEPERRASPLRRKRNERDRLR